jgi:hypothetical protein
MQTSHGSPSSGRQVSENLKARDDEEKNICESLKLLKQSLGEERKNRVLGCYNYIGRVLQFDVLLGLIKIGESR